MPEFAAPGVGRQSTRVTIDAEFGENANGVLYAVGGSGGGLSRLHGRRSSRLRIQHDDHRELPGAVRQDPAGQARDRHRHEHRQTGRPGECGHLRRRQGGGTHHRRAHRAGRLHRDEVLRCRRRPRLHRSRSPTRTSGPSPSTARSSRSGSCNTSHRRATAIARSKEGAKQAQMAFGASFETGSFSSIFSGADGGGRTHTEVALRGILSPLRLPVPPRPHVRACLSLVPAVGKTGGEKPPACDLELRPSGGSIVSGAGSRLGQRSLLLFDLELSSHFSPARPTSDIAQDIS